MYENKKALKRIFPPPQKKKTETFFRQFMERHLPFLDLKYSFINDK